MTEFYVTKKTITAAKVKYMIGMIKRFLRENNSIWIRYTKSMMIFRQKVLSLFFIQINLFGVLFERERKLGSWVTFFLKEHSISLRSKTKAKRRNYRQSDE